MFSPNAPYELLASRGVSHADLQRVKHLAQAFERFRNRVDLSSTLELLTGGRSAYAAWLEFSDWLHQRVGRAHSLGDRRRVELLWEFLVEERDVDRKTAAQAIQADVYEHGRGTARLAFLEAHFDPEVLRATRRRNRQPAN